MTVQVTPVAGGVCAAKGFTAAGVVAGLKPSGALDVALVASRSVAGAAAVLTRNQVVAAPVVVTRRNVHDGRARAVLLNAGNANACTGPDGLDLAEESTRAVAEALGCDPGEVLVCSTGVIGVPLPRQALLEAIPPAAKSLSRDGNGAAARAIMTTDTVPKEFAVRVTDDAGECLIGGMAKGVGMLAPEMATMLCVITTDAPLRGTVLGGALREATDRSFNRISVDACMSTNDAVIALASGDAVQPPTLEAFTQGLEAVCARLAEELVRDGEGASRLVRIRVAGAPSTDDAVGIGRAVASSALFRAAIAGCDPNWGRVLAAMGAGPVRFDPNRVAVAFGGVTVCRFGVATAFDRGQAAAAMRRDEVDITIDLGAGRAEATFLTCDLTHEYVTINAEYTT